MNMPRRLPISTQDFEKLRNAGDLYVDKTQYIEKLFSLGTVFFLSRPHRFGKSLFLSTLKAYFEGKKELFEGLYIAKREEEIARWQKREPWEASPVLYFDFNAKDYESRDTLKRRIDAQLRELEKRYTVKREDEDIEECFIHLIKAIYEQTQKQVVILVDEYDKPLLETVNDEVLNKEIRSLLKAFYEVLKQCDRYIRFAFLTGITKFSK
ncbi:MAG: AAA family ATPase, partial [Bacteroides sp.]